jgi:hypothetical protein
MDSTEGRENEDGTQDQPDPPEWRQRDIETTARQWVDQLGHFVNGMQSDQADAFATALANTHPTLLGQIAKAVAIGVMRRTMYDPEWRPWDSTSKRPRCTIAGGMVSGSNVLPHPEHDGRLSCNTVVGAELMARQQFI